MQQSIASGAWPGAAAQASYHLPFLGNARSSLTAWQQRDRSEAAFYAALFGLETLGPKGAWRRPAGAGGGVKATQQLISLEKRITKASPGVQAAYKSAREWLGPHCKIFTKESGDIVLMSQDGLRKLRFDVIYPHRDAPHIHLELFKNGKWRDALKDSHRIYPPK